MYRSRYSAHTVHKSFAREAVYRHDGSMAKKASKIDIIADLHADSRNHAHGCGLLVDHTDGSLVAIMPEMVVAGVSPGMAIMSRPTEHTQVMASSFSMVRAPASTASIMP